MKLAVHTLMKAVKRFDEHLETKGITIEQELQRLRENGQILGTTTTDPRSHQTTSINSR
jgi:hypothetical protein